MSRMFAVQIDQQVAVPALRLRRLGAWLAGCGLALAGYELARRGFAWSLVAAATATALLLARLLCGAARAQSARGILSVDDRGRFFWCGIEVELRRWQFAPGFAWLELRCLANAERIGLVLARSAFTLEQWAGIGRWVTWVGRGASTRRA